MLIDKQAALDVIAQHGTRRQVAQADQLLPPQTEPAQLAAVVQQIGLDPEILLDRALVDPPSIASPANGRERGAAEGLFAPIRRFFGF